MKSFSEIVRADNWLTSKIPPLLAVGYAAILLHRLPFSLAWRTLGLLFVCIGSVAAYGHVINDIFDLRQDLAAGKKNAMAGFSTLQRLGACCIFVVTGFAPLFTFDFGRTAIILLGVNYLLPTFYSMPPVRMKERGVLGVIADALGVHAVPTLFIALVVTHVAPASSRMLGLALAASAFTWALFAGLRGIIIHQIQDRHNDRRMNVRTFAGMRKRKSLRRLVLRFFIPVEVVGLLFFLSLLLPHSPILALFLAIYVIGEAAKIGCDWKLPMFYAERPRREPYLPLLNNEFHEVWLPCALASQLVFKQLAYLAFFAIHVILFRDIVLLRLRIFDRLLHSLPWLFQKIRLYLSRQ